MGFVVDTSVLSAFAPSRPLIPAENLRWALDNQARWYVPTTAVMEIEQGIRKLVRDGAGRKAALLSDWLDGLLTTFARRILSFDLAAARSAGALADRATASGRHPGLADITIAAIADVHGYAVLTRNLRHFEPIGVPAFDPFAIADTDDVSERPSDEENP